MHFGRDPSEISESLKALYREERGADILQWY